MVQTYLIRSSTNNVSEHGAYESGYIKPLYDDAVQPAQVATTLVRI